MIEIENLSKNYGIKKVLDSLTLHVRKGDVLGFIGPNGAGKTTTMKMICGVMPVYSGRIVLNGFDVMENPIQAKEITGYLPENAPLYPNMTVRSFLKYAGRMHGISGRDLPKKLELAVHRCALTQVMDEEIDSLSKGYKRRVCLAQAIIHEPQILVMDEPTDGLDPNQKREIRNLINILRNDTAIIISTHILEEVEAVCNRVALLCRGKKIFDGSTDEFEKLSGQIGTVSVSVAPESWEKASGCFSKDFGWTLKITGTEFRFCCNLNQEKTDELIARIQTLAEAENIHFSRQPQTVPAKLDDIFAELTGADNSHEGRTEPIR